MDEYHTRGKQFENREECFLENLENSKWKQKITCVVPLLLNMLTEWGCFVPVYQSFNISEMKTTQLMTFP